MIIQRVRQPTILILAEHLNTISIIDRYRFSFVLIH